MLTVTGADARASVRGHLTTGMVGIPVTIQYDGAWNGLTKNLVCRCGKWGPGRGETRTVLDVEDSAAVAHEVMQADMNLYLGVEGRDTDGKLVIPTIWADCGKIRPGANADADPSAAPNLSVWAQIQAAVKSLGADVAELKSRPVSGSDGGAADYGFLNGLKYYALGDSITEIQGTTADPQKYGNWYTTDLQGRDLRDITVSGYVQAIESRYGLVATNHGKSGHTLVGDYSTLASLNYSNAALVTIAYGVNDARTGVPLGTVNSTDATTFAGALNQLLRKIYTDNPECRVLVLAPLQRLTVTDFGIATPNANGNYLVDFVNMCRMVAEKRSTAFLDQYRCAGINQTNLYYYTVEGVHPVNQGFARISSAVIGVLDGLFALEYEPFGVMANTGETEPQEPDTGGDTGGDAPPEEDAGAAVIDLADKLTGDGYYYSYTGTAGLVKLGAGAYKGNAQGILTEAGKTYTLVTYLDPGGVWIGCSARHADPAACTDYADGWNVNKRGSLEEVTIDGTVYRKWTYSFTGRGEYIYFGCVNALVDRASLSCI